VQQRAEHRTVGSSEIAVYLFPAELGSRLEYPVRGPRSIIEMIAQNRGGDRHNQRIDGELWQMCRNIKPLFNFDPPVTEEEVKAASLQFVRKISGFTKPSKTNEEPFLAAVDEVAAAAARLLESLETSAAPRNREEEAAKAKARSIQRFGD
jgi:hypothetical protein